MVMNGRGAFVVTAVGDATEIGTVSYTHLAQVKKTFKPEFINRLSDMVVFNVTVTPFAASFASS